MSPIVNYVYQRERAEGFFRFHHIHVRTNAESIAFMSGGQVEEKIANARLQELIRAQESVILREFFLQIATNCSSYLGSIVSFLVLAVPVFAGVYDYLPPSDLSELISKNAFISIYLISQFSSLVGLADQFSVIAGTTHRIVQLLEDLQAKKRQADIDKVLGDSAYNVLHTPLGTGSDHFFNLNEVRLQEPQNSLSTGKVLVENLSLRIGQGKNILISGHSGGGKTSILRLLKGLWKETSGTIERHPSLQANSKLILFMPQKPAFTTGSLRQQLVYPDDAFLHMSLPNISASEDHSAIELKQHLRLVGMEHLLDRVDGDMDRNVTWNWYDKLSPGEMQRVAFVRLFYHKPMLAVLDEATSAISFEMEAFFYQELARRNITVVTAGHRESLRLFHDVLVTAVGNGQWNIQQIVNDSKP